MEINFLENLLENISDIYAKYMDLELSVIALNPADSNDFIILIKLGSCPVESKILPGALFQKFKILNGELFVETIQSGIADITFTDKIMEHQENPIRSSIVQPINHSQIGHGALLIGSYSTRLLSAKSLLKKINIDEVISDFSENLSDEKKDRVKVDSDNDIYQHLFRYSPIPTVLCSPDCTIQQSNIAFEKLSGVNNEVLLNQQTLGNFIPEHYLEEMRRAFSNHSSDSVLRNVLFQTENDIQCKTDLRFSCMPGESDIIIQLLDSVPEKEESIDEIEWSDKFKTINTILNSIFTKSKLDDLLDNIHHQLNEYFEFDYAAIAVHTKSASKLQVHLFYANKYNRLTFSSIKTLDYFRQFLNSLSKLETSDRLMPELFNIINRPVKKKLKSQLGMKLISPDNVGLFCFGSVLDKAYSQFHSDVLTGIAYPLACTVTKISIFEELTRHIQNLEAMDAVYHKLNQLNSSDEICKALCEYTQTLFDADQVEVEILLHKEKHGKSESIDFIKTRFKSQLIKVVQQQQIVNVDNIHAYIKNIQEENRSAKWRSFCLFPVISEQICIAVVYLLFNKTYRLNEQDAEIGRKYFQRVGAILHNSIKDNAIKSHNTRFEHILDSAADPVVCLDARGDITYFNERFSQLTGFAADEIRDRNVDAFLLNGSEIFNRIRSQLLTEHEIITIEADICCKSESLITLDWSFSRIKNACNKIKCYIGVGKYIGQHQKKRVQKQPFNRDTEELIFKLAHRLKTPLVSHDGYISLLEGEYQNQLPEEGRLYLRRLRENNEHMCNVIDDLLDYCKQQNKETRHELVNTRNLVSEIIKDSYDVEHIHFHLSDDLPKVNFDKGDILTIFTNLIENAVKYMGQRKNPRIEIGGQKENSSSYFYVKDNGIGIDAKYHKHIFDPFFRVKDQINVKGTGIGLTVVRNIIRRNNGEIRVESTPGQGTTIFFTIRDMQEDC